MHHTVLICIPSQLDARIYFILLEVCSTHDHAYVSHVSAEVERQHTAIFIQYALIWTPVMRGKRCQH